MRLPPPPRGGVTAHASCVTSGDAASSCRQNVQYVTGGVVGPTTARNTLFLGFSVANFDVGKSFWVACRENFTRSRCGTRCLCPVTWSCYVSGVCGSDHICQASNENDPFHFPSTNFPRKPRNPRKAVLTGQVLTARPPVLPLLEALRTSKITHTHRYTRTHTRARECAQSARSDWFSQSSLQNFVEGNKCGPDKTSPSDMD